MHFVPGELPLTANIFLYTPVMCIMIDNPMYMLVGLLVPGIKKTKYPNLRQYFRQKHMPPCSINSFCNVRYMTRL